MFGFNKKKKKEEPALSEKEVLQKLQIPDFKRMTKEKIPEFAELVPQMDGETVKTALNKLPNFAPMTAELVSCYKSLIDQTLNNDRHNMQAFNQSCDKIIQSLNSLLNERKIRFGKKKVIIENITEILRLQRTGIAADRSWALDVVKTAGKAAVGIVAVVAVILKIK